MARFSLHAVAPNQREIVAAVTQSLAEIGCNLEESWMSLIRGQFSIVLVLEAPGISNGMVIEEALAPLLEDYALQLFVRSIPEYIELPDPTSLIFVSVQGADQPGTVARIARAISDAGGTIVDLVGRVILEGTTIPSRLELTASVEPGVVPTLRTTLDALALELGMRCDLRPATAEAS